MTQIWHGVFWLFLATLTPSAQAGPVDVAVLALPAPATPITVSDGDTVEQDG